MTDRGVATYLLGAFLGALIVVVWLAGTIMTRHEARIISLERQLIGLQESQAHTLARMEHATREMVQEVNDVFEECRK